MSYSPICLQQSLKIQRLILIFQSTNRCESQKKNVEVSRFNVNIDNPL